MTDYLGRSNPNWCRYLVLGECVNPKRKEMINCRSRNCEFGRTPPKKKEDVEWMKEKGLFYYDVFVFIIICIASFICLYGFIKSNNLTMIIFSLFFII